MMKQLYQDPVTKELGVITERGFTLVNVKPVGPPRQVVLRRNPMNKNNELEQKIEEAARPYAVSDLQIGYTVSPAALPAWDLHKPRVRIDSYAVQLYWIVI